MGLSDDLHSIPRLVGDAVEQLAKLVQNEAQLARTELSEKLAQAGTGAAYLAAAGIFAIPVLVLLSPPAPRGRCFAPFIVRWHALSPLPVGGSMRHRFVRRLLAVAAFGGAVGDDRLGAALLRLRASALSWPCRRRVLRWFDRAWRDRTVMRFTSRQRWRSGALCICECVFFVLRPPRGHSLFCSPAGRRAVSLTACRHACRERPCGQLPAGPERARPAAVSRQSSPPPTRHPAPPPPPPPCSF